MAAVDTTQDLAYYRQCMRIDRHNLPQECSDQPLQHAKIARQAVLASSRLSAMDLRVAQDFGWRAASARKALGKTNTGRITDIMVKSRVDQDPKSAALPEQRAALKQVLGEWEALRDASKDRGFMISKLVDIWIAGLLTPSEPRMSTRGERAKAFADNDGAPPPPEAKTNGRAPSGVGYEESRTAIDLARQQNGAVLPKPTTQTREQL